jgi:ribonuclease E
VLVRTLRDHTDSTVESIIVDSPGAFERAKMFLDVIAPKTSGKVMYYNGKAPIFEAYGIERQIDEIHSRTVALPSGGALVFDQTEALVAIDVNSGRSRSARDSETNAYQTNSEAVEEVCRQLRLRDLGGLIVVDCIDMRLIKHRRDIEERLTTLLKIDRAKSSFAPISEFGIIEMTRQRMRPSLRKMHYADCTHCGGSGEIRVPAAVAADAMRRVALLFSHAKIQRVEIVCSVRVAAEFMSNRRRAMHELEDRSSKRIDVRISEAFAADRVEMYAYDENNSDIELDRLPPLGGPLAGTLHEELPEAEEVELTPSEALARRRRRKRRPAPADATAIALAGGFEDLPEVLDDEVSVRDSMTDRDEQSGSSRSGRSGESRQGDSRQGANRGGRDTRGGRGGRGGRTDDQKSAPSSDRTPNAGNRSNANSGSDSNRNENAGSRGQRSNRRRRGRGRRTVGSIMDMVQERSAFETNRVAGVLDTTVEELLTRLRADCDVETAALLTLETFMLPPELIARAQTLYPEVDRGSDSESDGNAAGNEDAQSADSPQDGQQQDGQHQDGQRDSSTSGGRDDRGPNRNDGGGRSGRGRRGGSRRGGGGNSGGNSGSNSGGGNRGGRNDNRGDSRSQGGSQGGGGASQGSSSHRERQPLKIDQRSDTPTPAPAPTPPPTPAAAPAPTPTAEAPAKPKRRSLYGAAMRLISPFEKSKAKGRKE